MTRRGAAADAVVSAACEAPVSSCRVEVAITLTQLTWWSRFSTRRHSRFTRRAHESCHPTLRAEGPARLRAGHHDRSRTHIAFTQEGTMKTLLGISILFSTGLTAACVAGA